MKTKSYYVGLVLLGFLTWSCSNTDELGSSKSLKTSINSNAQELTLAMNAITSSAGYQALSTSAETTTASYTHPPVAAFDSTYSSILLADISGVYNYKATKNKWNPSILQFFVRSADNADMIVNLPKEKVQKPYGLLRFSPKDSALVNDYKIDLSKYEYKFNRFLGWDYNMASNINISGVNAGDLQIQSSNSKAKGYHFASTFAFASGYTTNTSYTSGDTIISLYNISKDKKTLYEEKYTAIRTSTTSRHREKEYSLTIGNVQIVRTPGKSSLDSAKVYVGGVLQLHSVVKFIDVTTTSANPDSTETSITNHKRELQITFDDGTSTTIKQLLGSTIDNIRTLFVSLRQTYFATGVVDWIAWDIYKNKK
jgi:hypothetical protein